MDQFYCSHCGSLNIRDGAYPSDGSPNRRGFSVEFRDGRPFCPVHLKQLRAHAKTRESRLRRLEACGFAEPIPVEARDP